MRIYWKWTVLAVCLLVGPSLTPAPIVETAGIKKFTLAEVILPRGTGTTCRFVSSASGVRRWENADVIPGAQVPDIATLAKLSERPIIVYQARLAGQRLAGATLSNVCFEEGDLSRTDWRGVSARGVKVFRSNLRDAMMAGASLQEAMFSNSQLDGADASGADLTGARIEGGSVDGLSLRKARMRGFQLHCGLLSGYDNCDWPETRGVDARGADLTRARFEVYRADDWNFAGARIDRTVVQFLQLKRFAAAIVKGPIILESSGYENDVRVRLNPAEWRQLLSSDWTNGPGFACAKARSVVERSICRSDSLPEIDRELARVYRDARANGTTTIGAQRRWLDRRDSCSAKPEADYARDSCISTAYHERVDELRKSLPVVSKFEPGEERLFISSEMVPPPAFARTALYPRIFPILIATASTRLFVRAIGAVRIRATGEAFGGNGHLCSLSPTLLDFSAASGSFGVRHGGDPREEVLKFSGEEAMIGPPDGDGRSLSDVMCGARAGFDKMAQVTIPASQRSDVAKMAPRF